MEMMIVVAIMAIMAAIAFPSYQNMMARNRLNGAARQVMSDLMEARMKAVKLNCDVAVAFVFDNPEYKIWTDSNNNGTKDSGEEITRNIQSNYYDVKIKSTRSIEFHSRGTANPFGSITLTNPTGSKNVKAHITGRVMIE